MKYTRLLAICVVLLAFVCSGWVLAAETKSAPAVKQATGGCGGGGGSTQSSAQSSAGGCGSSSGGCGCSGAASAASDPLKLTPAQKQRLGAIDKQYDPHAQKLQNESVQLRNEFGKLNKNPKADEQRLAHVVRRMTYLQGEMFLWDRQRDKAKDRVYTAEQKTIMAKANGGGGGCGGGSSAGGSGAGSSSGGCGGGSSSGCGSSSGGCGGSATTSAASTAGK